MKGFRPTVVKLCIGTFFVLSPVVGYGAVVTWDGSTDNEWADSTNWNPGVPTVADVATFANGPTNIAPTIESNETFSVNGLNYTNAAAPTYNVNVLGELNVVGGNIANTSEADQFLNVADGTLNFYGAGAVIGDTTPTTHLMKVTGEERGVINFYDDTTVGAQGFVSVNKATVNFYEDATYGVNGNALQASNNGVINFHQDSRFLGSGLQLVGNSKINFNDNSRFSGVSSNTATDSTVNFNDSSLYTTGTLSLTNSDLNFNDVAQITGGTVNAAASDLHFNQYSQLTGGTVNLSDSNSSATFNYYSQQIGGTINADNGADVTFNSHSQQAGGTILATDGSSVIFNGNARLRAGTLTTQNGGSNVSFNDYSHQSGGTVNVDLNTYGYFYDHSVKDGGTLNVLSGSTVYFYDYSKLLGGTNVLNASNLYFYGQSLANGVTIQLENGSQLYFNNDSQISNSRILSDASVTHFNLDGCFADNTTLELSNGSSVIFNPSVNGTFLGVIEDDGAQNVFKSGSGVLNLVTDSPNFSGTTTLSDGTTYLNAFWNSSFVVNDAKLRGEGTIGGNLTVNNLGTVEPGNSPGTIHVNGNTAFNNGSTFIVDIDGEGNNGFLDIDGTLAIGNTNTVVLVKSEDAAVIGGQTYHILHADGGVPDNTDNFTSYTATNPLLLVQGPSAPLGSDININVSVPVAAYVNNKNQLRVLEQLVTNAEPSSDLLNVLTSLNTLSGDDASDALDSLTGEQYANLVQVSQQANRRFLTRLHIPGRFDRDCSCSDCFIWAEFAGGRSTFNNDKHIKGLDVNHYGFTIGTQKDCDDNIAVGAAFGYEYEDLKFKLNGSGHGNTFQGAIYGVYSEQCGYILGDLLLGFSEYTVHRNVHWGEGQNEINRHVHGSPQVWDFTGYFEAGMNYSGSCFVVQPFVGAELGTYKFEEFKEHGGQSINLKLDDRHVNNFDGRLGIHFLTTLPCNLLFGGDLAYRHRFSSTRGQVTAEFREFGDDFKVLGVNTHRDGVEWAAWIQSGLGCGWDIYLETTGEHFDGLTDWSLTAGTVYNW